MMDGNFKLINLEKEKKNNKDDTSLWDGRGYFRRREDVDAHMKEHYGLVVEVSASLCSSIPCTDFYLLEREMC